MLRVGSLVLLVCLSWIALGPAAAHAQNAVAPSPPPPAPAAPVSEPPRPCFPACREGYVCAPSGQCVSACNPACAPGQICTATGQCLDARPASAPVLIASQGPQPDPGWAKGAGVYGFIAAGVTMALTAAVISNNDAAHADTGRGFGIAATSVVLVSVPIVAIGGASARHNPAVSGSSGLRVVSWIGYVLTVLDAVSLIAVSYDQSISSAQILSVGTLGALSSVGMGLDAILSANEATALARPNQAMTVRPYAGLVTGRGRGAPALPTLGLAFRF